MYLRGLHSLDLSDNLLEGGNPEGTANLYDLRVINLKNNRFTGKLLEAIVVSANEEITLMDWGNAIVKEIAYTSIFIFHLTCNNKIFMIFCILKSMNMITFFRKLVKMIF